jgi:hypothetical protein
LLEQKVRDRQADTSLPALRLLVTYREQFVDEECRKFFNALAAEEGTWEIVPHTPGELYKRYCSIAKNRYAQANAKAPAKEGSDEGGFR